MTDYDIFTRALTRSCFVRQVQHIKFVRLLYQDCNLKFITCVGVLTTDTSNDNGHHSSNLSLTQTYIVNQP